MRPGEARTSGEDPAVPNDRRDFLSRASSLAMLGGLAAAGAGSAAMAGRYLYPPRRFERRWVFLVEVDRLAPGASMNYWTPGGERVAVARVGAGATADDFVALSSTCPHLGCQVHWEAHRDRFFCPCHNGVFDRGGRALEGPPAEAGQSLSKYPLRVENGLLFVEVPVEGLTVARADGAAREETA